MTEGERETIRMLDAAKCNTIKENEDRIRGLGVFEYTSSNFRCSAQGRPQRREHVI